MRITIGAVGRLRNGPEKDLIDRYLKSFKATGAAAGITDIAIVELDERKAGNKSGIWEKIDRSVSDSRYVILLDESGKSLNSEKFAERLSRWGESHRDIVFLIGGADGHDDAIRQRADFTLSLGVATWPHMLARVLLVEQIYRASTIISGHPYHRA